MVDLLVFVLYVMTDGPVARLSPRA